MRLLTLSLALLAARVHAAAPATAVQTGTPHRMIAADSSTKTLAAIGPDGHILYQDGWTRIVELDEHHKPIWDYNAKRNGNAGRTVEVHAFERLPDGITMIVESGPARIIEVDHDGNLVREIKLTVDAPSAHSDTRNARKTAAGTYLVAHEKDGVVREYDTSGKVIWEFDVPLFDKPRKGGHGPEAFGDQVYSAVRLATGNTRFVNCHAGPDNPQIVEVTPEKQVVWTFKDFTTFGNSLAVAVVR